MISKWWKTFRLNYNMQRFFASMFCSVSFSYLTQTKIICKLSVFSWFSTGWQSTHESRKPVGCSEKSFYQLWTLTQGMEGNQLEVVYSYPHLISLHMYCHHHCIYSFSSSHHLHSFHSLHLLLLFSSFSFCSPQLLPC